MSWLDDLVEYGQSQLGSRQREALWSRGVSDAQIDLFRIGYLNLYLPPLGYSKEFLTLTRSGELLDGVFVLPLTNILGQIKGLQFRPVDRDRKAYRTFYHERDESVYFGLGQAMPRIWETETVWLVEGAFDLFPLQRVFQNSFSALTLGTSEALAQLLRRFVKQVWLLYDCDRDGRRACYDFRANFGGDDLDVQIPTYPKLRYGKRFVKDPGEIWEVWGDGKLRDYLLRQANQV